MPARLGKLYIGTSGWNYRGWQGTFYPKGVGPAKQLAYMAQRTAAVEVNGTHYSLQRPDTFRQWHDQAPADYVFALKGSRYITHMKQLKDVRGALANFFASGPLELRGKLGPILWQLPERTRFNPDRLSEFFELLPRDTVAAAELAREHDHRLKAEPATDPHRKRRLRHVLEPRHESFFTGQGVALLRKHKIGLVLADTAGRWPYSEDLTADLVYIRLHGAEQLYASGYSDGQLDWWATRIDAWRRGDEPADARHASDSKPRPRRARDVYVFFDNDAKVHAPFDAMRLIERT